MRCKAIFFMAAVSTLTSTAAGAITYTLDRTIGSGVVTGFIETDGTLGVLAATNITDWSITLTASGLFGGSPQTNTASTGTESIFGTGLVADATQITFDFDLAGGNFFLAGANSNWCMSGPASLNCFGEMIDVSEGIYFNTAGTGPAELEARSGVVTLASVPPPAVPLPASLPLMALGLGGLVLAGRRKAS